MTKIDEGVIVRIMVEYMTHDTDPLRQGWIEFDEARYGAGVIESRIGELKAEGDGREIVRKALESPIGSPRLRELARGKKSCVVIISDHTRPVPSKLGSSAWRKTAESTSRCHRATISRAHATSFAFSRSDGSSSARKYTHG